MFEARNEREIDARAIVDAIVVYMMYGFGDVKEFDLDLIEFMEDMLVDYFINVVY